MECRFPRILEGWNIKDQGGASRLMHQRGS